MLRIVSERVWPAVSSNCCYPIGGSVRKYAVFPSPEALEQPCCPQAYRQIRNEPILEPRVGTRERDRLCQEVTDLCSIPPVISIVAGTSNESGDSCTQVMPFQHERAAAYYNHARSDTLKNAMIIATNCQRDWERRSVDERCTVIEKAAELIAGDHRQRIIAAAMVGQGMTAIQAEYNITQLVDYMRYGCIFMRELVKSRCVIDGGKEAHNRNQYHGLEGFWAAITPCDSFAFASQLAITPAITGNCVVWKPSDYAVLACYRIFESLQLAGLACGVINFVPAEEKLFLDLICSSCNLAGISFAGTTKTLEHIWSTVGERISKYARFPRIVGTGSGKNFHVVHSSADISNAVSCTVRAAFELSGQKSFSCSRVFVAQSVLKEFIEMLQLVTKSLAVCHPLDYRCFTSSLMSKAAFDKAVSYMVRAAKDKTMKLVVGGRYDNSIGYYIEPTVYLIPDPTHEIMCSEVRGPLLAVCPCPDLDKQRFEKAVSEAPYAMTGSIFAQDPEWSRWAVGVLRDYATTLYLNDRCSEERPAQQSVGGSRKSGTGAKAGSISYLLHFCTERSLRETLHLNTDVTYRYMNELPTDILLK